MAKSNKQQYMLSPTRLFGREPIKNTTRDTNTIYRVEEPFDCPSCSARIEVGMYVTLRKRGPKDPPVNSRLNWHTPSKPYCRNCYSFSINGSIPADLM